MKTAPNGERMRSTHVKCRSCRADYSEDIEPMAIVGKKAEVMSTCKENIR